MKLKKFIAAQLLCSLLFFSNIYAQSDSIKSSEKANTIAFSSQTDIIDILSRIFKKESSVKSDTSGKKLGNVFVSLLPGAGYTLQTKFAVALAGNAAFYTDEGENANLSVIHTTLIYTQFQQFILPINSKVWTKGNKYCWIGDWRYYKYPQNTYGLGGRTTLSNSTLLDYSFVTVDQTVFRNIYSDFFAGIGYNLDYHWNISEVGFSDGRMSDYKKYGETRKSVSSGISLNFLYDDRRNSINPPKGFYSNIIYRPNLILLGSDNNWQSLLIDFRKYFKLPNNSKNVFAIWSYTWLTLSGKAPYLDLPSTAWDTYANMGRGYIQSRFRGNNLLYLESEYRFGITRNGLMGGVVFANAQAVSEYPSNKFETVLPGVGAGLRIKVNKYSNTNISIDYGFGVGGSQGLFINLGEVF